MKNYAVKFYSDEKLKPTSVSARAIPCHLQARAIDSLENMIKHGVIEEHQSNEPVSWVSCAVIATKDDSSLRVTLDARNSN